MILAINKRAHHDYTILKTDQAGLVLLGQEVKSLRAKAASLTGSYLKIINQEVWLINAQVNPYRFAVAKNYDPKRTRKVLLTKKEIFRLQETIALKRLSLIPLSLELVRNRIKLNFGLGKGKKEFEKRASLKEKDVSKQLARSFKQQNLKI